MAVAWDADGYYCITGRVDDINIVSGQQHKHRRNWKRQTEHHAVSKEVYCYYPHHVKGNAIYGVCDPVMKTDNEEKSRAEIRDTVAKLSVRLQSQIRFSLKPDCLKHVPGKLCAGFWCKIAGRRNLEFGEHHNVNWSTL